MIHGSKAAKSRYSNYGRNHYKMNIGETQDVLHGPRTDFSTSGNNKDVPGSDFYGAPYFGQTNTEVLVQEGNHAFFHCPVHNIRNQTVCQKGGLF